MFWGARRARCGALMRTGCATMGKTGNRKMTAGGAGHHRFAAALLALLLSAFALGGCSSVQGAASLPDTGAGAASSGEVAAAGPDGAPAAPGEEAASDADAHGDAAVPAASGEGEAAGAAGAGDAAAPAASASDAAADAAVTSDDGAPAVSAADRLTVRFIDVGQGDCALLTCGGETLLIDGGPSEASSKLYSILKSLDISRLDYIICTHPDEDHCGGISGALNFASCGTFFCSVTEHDTRAFASVLRYLGQVPVTVPAVGDGFSLGAAQVTFVGPAQRTRDTNEGSLVCRVDLGEVSFLFTGDAGEESEEAMLAAGAPLDADVLKVGHHGSAGSSTSQFLAAVSPDYAVISVGAGNSYGHPTDEALARLGATGATVLRTDELGSVVAVTDGRDVQFSSTKGKLDN